MNQEKIGKFIQTKRKEKNLTQQKLADKIGVTDRAISKWERGLGLPDYSLIKPLCEALGITINELLSGETITKEKEQQKFEENLLNTLDYSDEKIKHTKFIYKIILTIIILFISTIGILFAIDVSKMRNMEPVFFSTWGFKYAPSINIKEKEIFLATKEYLISKSDNEPKHHLEEKAFATMKVFLLEETKKDKLYYVYALVNEAKYYLENDELKRDSASLIPYKFKIEKINDEYKVTDSRIPRDGSYYEDDIKNIFPKSVRNSIDDAQYDGTVEKLEMEIEEKAKLYFHK